MKQSKQAHFATVKEAQTTFLEILTEPIFSPAAGAELPALKITTVSPNVVAFEFCIANRTFDQNFWSGPVFVDGQLDTSRYNYDVVYSLKHFFRAEVIDRDGVVIASREPLLYNPGEDECLDYPRTPYHEASTFDGFWISARWVNFTTENSQGALDGPGGVLVFPNPIPDGDYTLRITLDPIGLYKQGAVYEIPFTLAAANVAQAAFNPSKRK